MITVDAGSPLLIEVQFSKAEPFKGYTTFDPSVHTYITKGPDGLEVVQPTASGSLLKVPTDPVDAGRFYCVIKTGEGWENGNYTVKITSSHGEDPDTTSDIDVKESVFTLKNSVPVVP